MPEQTNRSVRGLLQKRPRKHTILQAATGAEGLARAQDFLGRAVENTIEKFRIARE